MTKASFKQAKEAQRLSDAALVPFTGELVYDNLLRHWREAGFWRARLIYDEYVDRCRWDLAVGRNVAPVGEHGGVFCSEKCRDEYAAFQASFRRVTSTHDLTALDEADRLERVFKPEVIRGCDQHPAYGGKRRPRTTCEGCWAYFQGKHPQFRKDTDDEQTV